MSGTINANEVPFIRIAKAISEGAQKSLLLVVGGGLGDRACAEPTVRFAIENFKDCEISLCCDTPEIFEHLQVKAIFNKVHNVFDHQYLPLYTYAQGLANQFISANLVNGVDFASISALRRQLCNYDRMIKLCPKPNHYLSNLVGEKYCLVHVGKGWPSKTFPAQWWDQVTGRLLDSGVMPVLVGKDCIKVDTSYCHDLTEQTSLNDFMWLCINSKYVITNDSSPLHFAAAGQGRIAFVATCKDAAHLYHVTRATMRSFFRDRMWDYYPSCPNEAGLTSIAELPPGKRIEDFLPEPSKMVEWVLDVKP